MYVSIGDGSATTITWTTWNETESIVEFGVDPTRLNETRGGYSRLFVDGGSEKRRQFIHRVQIEDLKPNTSYFYHVGSQNGWSDLFFFKTLPFDSSDWSPRLALFGDMGNANAQSLARLQRETQEGLYDAILHVGDFAYDMDSDNARVGDEFMRQIESIAAYVPYMTCPGNHEEKYNFSNYRARFSMPGQTESMFFSFDMGPVHFISLSTEFYYFTNYGMKMVANQYKWLLDDLKKANEPENRSKRPWIVMFGHRPMYCTTADEDDCTKVDTFTRVGLPIMKTFGLEKLLLKYDVDLTFWAHEHNYERLWPIYNYTVYNGTEEAPYTNPGAPVHITTGSAGCQERHDGWGPKRFFTAFRSNDYGYTRIKAHNASHMEIEQVSDDKVSKIQSFKRLTLIH